VSWAGGSRKARFRRPRAVPPAVGARAARRAPRRQAVFGPASSLRSILEAGAAPLAAALHFDPPAAVESTTDAIAATLASNGRSIALLVVPWGERFDPQWRTAVTEALRRAAAWCLLFDGARLRIIDASRPYPRRFV